MNGRHTPNNQVKTFTILNYPQKNKKTWYAQITLLLLAGSIMIAHGARMIYQGIFHPTSTYQPNTFDLCFDWLTLVILGGIVFTITLHSYYHQLTRHHNQPQTHHNFKHQPT